MKKDDSEILLQRVKEDLKDLERYIEEFSVFLPLAICTVSPRGIITDVNRAFSELTHYKDLKIIGEEVEVLFKNKKRWKKLEEKILKGKLVKGKEIISTSKAGKEIPVSISASIRKEEEGTIIGYFLALSDITEIKKLREELEEKVKERTKELQKRVEELEKFHELTIGRELKMAEMKKELKKLKEESGKYKERSEGGHHKTKTLKAMDKKFTETIPFSVREIKKAMKNPCKIKGSAFKGELEYILAKKGEKGLKVVEERTKKLGYPIRYREIRETQWYPIGLKMVSFYAFLTTFNWGKRELVEIAESSVKISYIVKFFMKHFASVEKIFKVAAPRLWKRYFSVGSLEAADFYNIEKRGGGGQGILRIKNFKIHPFYCFYLGLFFIGIAKLTDQRFKEINIEETKCMFKGDDCHEYLLKWAYK